LQLTKFAGCFWLDIKAAAILKLIYLEMFGHDMSWASFHVLEVMSSPKFMQKRVGYLAATQSFTTETDVLMLTTNLIKKVRFNPPIRSRYTDYGYNRTFLHHIPLKQRSQ